AGAVLAASAAAGAAGLDWAVNAAARLSSSLPRLGLAALLAAAAEPGGALLGAMLGLLLSQPHASSIAAEARRLALEEYSEASIAAGASRLHVARRHVAPALASAAARYAALTGASSLYAATGLQAVGLGSPQEATWGSHIHLILSTPGAAATAAGALQLAAALAFTALAALAARVLLDPSPGGRDGEGPPLGWLLA
ncbi:MAG: ABC transporter permease subunit, partial [Crenarchaeota archaeon]|nr:ABC transporter permease subunit [Thermoproteota archaeon]